MLFQARSGEGNVWHWLFLAYEHGAAAMRFYPRPGNHGCCFCAGCGRSRICAGRKRVHGRRSYSVAARWPGDYRRRFSSRGTCNERARFGGSVRGACVHRAWRSVLGRQCARRHLRIDARGHKSAHSACVPRGASIPGTGRAARHGSRCGNSGICVGG